jgi:hypothetical protein
MLQRFKRIWHPEQFHFHHRLHRGEACFEGWYFKLVDAAGERPYAIIPGVFLGAEAHAFIQVLDGRAGSSDYHRFPLDAFQASTDRFDVRIGRSRFTSAGITLDIGADETDPQSAVSGDIRCSGWAGWPVTLTRPGVMGPYSFVPFMECNHGILSMDHGLQGELSVNGSRISYEGGRGYVEKDWGRGFPRGYVWAQSNHFEEAGVSVSASVARIPWLTGAFRGHLVGFLLRGKLHRFTTYNGTRIEKIHVDDDNYRLTVCDHKYRLRLLARRTGGALLHAPYEQQMVERVAEAMNSEIQVHFARVRDGEVLFEGTGSHGCLEVQGDLSGVLEP